MSDSFFEVEHRPDGEVVLRFKSPKFWGLPDTTYHHLLTARKEFLLALRNMLDQAIERTEKAEEKRAKKKTKITVQ